MLDITCKVEVLCFVSKEIILIVHGIYLGTLCVDLLWVPAIPAHKELSLLPNQHR